MIYFLRGYIIEETIWKLDGSKQNQSHSFLLSEEIEAFREDMISQNYTKAKDCYHKLIDNTLYVRNIKSPIPKTYVYKDKKVIYWGKAIEIIRQYTDDVLDIDDVVVKGNMDNIDKE